MLKIYNTLKKKKEFFQPLKANSVNIYVCGPTVYDHLHIGNVRPLIFFNMVKKYLQNLNFKVFYVVNITDIDDKIIKVALENNITEQIVTAKYIQAFLDIMHQLDIKSVDFLPKVTDFVTPIIKYIEKLIDRGYCYINDHGVYFRVNLIDDYGKLSAKNISQLKKNYRKKVDFDKENHQDFILWKKTSLGVKYNSPWFDGRPGWHTECVVIIQKIFKGFLDIHGGGIDLKFPHHENELAQAFAYNKHPLTNFFMHIGRIDYNKQKMSKSLKNVILVKDLLKKFNPNALKFLILAHHYRQPININYFLIEQFENKYQKIKKILQKNILLLTVNNIFDKTLDQFLLNDFYRYMNDDFNIPNVITLIEKGLKNFHQNVNLQRLAEIQNTLFFIFNILDIKFSFKIVTEEIIKIYNLWKKEIENKNFLKSNYYRKILVQKGFI